MVTGIIKNKIDKIWTDIWAGGITNPLTVIEQLTYLMFIRSLDEKELENEEFENINDSNIDTLLMAEAFVAKFPCKAMRIYTDTCATDLFDFQKISNDYPITNIDSYMFPRFNQGFWTYNYFRNIKNAHANKTTYSDQHSLIEGKYVVVRFVFDKEFKLETLSLNYSNKI